jgi:integrase
MRPPKRGRSTRSGRTGQPQHATNLYRRWLKAATRTAGIEWAAFHSLRHTAASRWLHAGYNIAVVSRLLGHSNAAFTMSVYVHVRADDLPSGAALAEAVGQ